MPPPSPWSGRPSAAEPRRTERAVVGRRPTPVESLGSGVVGFLVFMLLTPVSETTSVTDCPAGAVDCPESVVHECVTLLGWQDVLGPLSCSPWGAAAMGLLTAVLLRVVGVARARRRARVFGTSAGS